MGTVTSPLSTIGRCLAGFLSTDFKQPFYCQCSRGTEPDMCRIEVLYGSPPKKYSLEFSEKLLGNSEFRVELFKKAKREIAAELDAGKSKKIITEYEAEPWNQDILRKSRDAIKIPWDVKVTVPAVDWQAGECSQPKRTTCPLCGETDSKYPPWEGECSHENRRTA